MKGGPQSVARTTGKGIRSRPYSPRKATPMKRIVPVILIVALSALTGCQHANVGARCKGNGWGENGAWILQCKGGRWAKALTKADYLRLVAPPAAPAPAPAAPTTTAAAAAPTPAPTTTAAPATMGTGTSAREQLMANEIFAAINAERAARGLAPAARSNGTNTLRSALITGMDTSNPHPAEATINDAPWPDYPNLGHLEDTTWGTSVHTSGQAVVNWMNSSPHRALIVRPDLIALQVAVVCMSDGRYVAKIQSARPYDLPGAPATPNAVLPQVTTPLTGSRCQ